MSIHPMTIIKLSVVMAISLLAGCDSGSLSADESGDGISDSSRKTIRMVVNNSDRKFPEGMDENHNPYLSYIENATGINISFMLPPFNGYQETLNTIMNSSDQPDLIQTADPMWVYKYVTEQALLPLDDLIEAHAPELFQIFPKEAWEAVTFNGQIYAIPSLNEVSGNEVIYARKDWLDALGLEPPRTLEQYYDVMYAFTYGDPDQNGVNDTYGLTIIPSGLSRTAPFFGAFGVPRGLSQISMWKERDGKLVYSGILPEAKSALAYLAKLYGDGILDREFILNKLSSFKDKIIDGRVGLFSAAWYDTRGPILENMKKDPKAEWIRLEYPIGYDGEYGTAEYDLIQSYSVIPKGSLHAKEVIEVLHFIAGEGYRELKLGFEGEVWTKQNGMMVTNFEEHEKHIYRGTLHALADPNDGAVRRDRLSSLGEQYDLNENVEYIVQNVLHSDYRGPQTVSMRKYGSQLLKLEEETYLKIIMGLSVDQEFEKFAKQWITNGGWEITNEVNDWYRLHTKGAD
ncbi:extracellular solute-binding protein [Paenibacillus pinisoli]|nr:extracellular solute-binding protein [Paenibacillus pinisoli]